MNFSKLFLFIFLISTILGCKNQSKEVRQKDVIEKENTSMCFQNKGHKLVYEMIEKVGDYKKLRSKKDVIYTYTYTTPDGKSDVSTEKYIFANELSYGRYTRHERTLPELNGVMQQGYDGENYWLKIDENEITDEEAIKKVKFNRPTNFYWFTMFQKLLDPGLNYEYFGTEKIDDNQYDKVKISFESKNDKPTDIYQLYINQETGLVDQFLFTVVDYGVVDAPFLMQLEYEKVDGFLIPAKRRYKTSTWDAEVTNEPWIKVNWTDISFNNGLQTSDFKK